MANLRASSKTSKSVTALPSLTLPSIKPEAAVARSSSMSSLPRVPPRRRTMEPQFDLASDLGPSPAALNPNALLGRGKALFGQAGPRKEASGDTSDALACQLALRHRLMLSEVKRIIRELIAADRNDSGGLEYKDFAMVLCRIFDADAVDDKVGKEAYRHTGTQQGVNIERFLDWYVQNMFTQVNSLNASPASRDAEKMISEIAKKAQVSTLAVDNVKRKFDHFDLDHSGMIDFAEFQEMFCVILKLKSAAELNPERIKHFWQEIDHNGDGGVDFAEFANWYLKYFNPESEDDEFDMAGPLRAFYDSFNPGVQRRKANCRTGSLPSVN